MWIKWWALTFVTLGIYGFWVPIKVLKWQASHTYAPGLEGKPATQVAPAAQVALEPAG